MCMPGCDSCSCLQRPLTPLPCQAGLQSTGHDSKFRAAMQYTRKQNHDNKTMYWFCYHGEAACGGHLFDWCTCSGPDCEAMRKLCPRLFRTALLGIVIVFVDLMEQQQPSTLALVACGCLDLAHMWVHVAVPETYSSRGVRLVAQWHKHANHRYPWSLTGWYPLSDYTGEPPPPPPPSPPHKYNPVT